MARVPTGIPGFKEALLDATKILTRFETATEQAARRTSRYGEEAGKAGHNLRAAGKDALKAFAFAKAIQTGVSVAKGAAGEAAAAAGVNNVVERRKAARGRARAPDGGHYGADCRSGRPGGSGDNALSLDDGSGQSHQGIQREAGRRAGVDRHR